MLGKTHAIFIILISLTFSCQQAKKTTNGVNVTISSYKNKELLINLDTLPAISNFQDLAVNIYAIPLESGENSMLGAISKVAVLYGNFYILDGNYSSLKQFSADGKYIRTFGSLGTKRGQYKELQDFLIDTPSSQVVLLANDKDASLLFFDLDGSFLTQAATQLFGRNFARMGSHWYYYINDNTSDLSGDNNLVVLNSDDAVLAKGFKVPAGYTSGLVFSGFLLKGADGMLYSSPLSDTVYQVTNFEAYPRYIFNFGSSRLPDSIRLNMNRFLQRGANYSFLQNTFTDTRSFLTFNFIKNRRLYQGYYNKIDNKLFVIGRRDNDPFVYAGSAPVGIVNDSSRITYLNASDLTKIYQSNPAVVDSIRKYYPNLYNIMPGLKSTDNPILIIYRLKV